MTESNPPSASHQPPPPPPPGGYGYYPSPPPPPRRSWLGGVTKLGGLVSMMFILFLVGFYTAIAVMSNSSGVQASTWRDGEGRDKIAILPLDGTVSASMEDFTRRSVQKILDDDSIKAVVLRVQSPGGSASAADEVLHDLSRLKTERHLPIIASYGGYAASGGYYISCQADKIFAEPTTITGSIGVIAEVPTFQQLLQQKLGVKVEVITSTHSTDKATANDLFRDWTDKDRDVVRGLMDVIHGQFVSVVATGRAHAMGPDAKNKVLALATGRVFTAPAAKEAGLVDEIGYIDAAIEEARERAHIAEKHPPVVTYAPSRGLGGLLGVSVHPVVQVPDAQSVRDWMTELSAPRFEFMSR